MIVVEDIKATTHGKGRHWNSSFSPLQLGKTWFYEECEKNAPTHPVTPSRRRDAANELGRDG